MMESSVAPNGETQQAQETQGEGKAETKVEAPGAPEKYEFSMPDGVKIGSPVIDAFSEVAKDLNMPQDAAQKILSKVAPVIEQQQAAQIAAVHAEWAEQSKSDKEFGGDKIAENLAVAKRALDVYASPELRALLNTSKLGDHPEMIRLFYRLGRDIKEDGIVKGGAPLKEKSMAERMFSNSLKE